MLDRAGVTACPNRVAAVYLELAVLVRALRARRRGATRRRARPLVALGGLFDLRDTLSGRPSTTCAPSPRNALRAGTPCPSAVTRGATKRMARDERMAAWRPESSSSGRSTSTSSCESSGCREPGETVGGGTFARVPGGKGANQAVACARLGAEVTMIGAVGRDAFADEALAGLREAGVALELHETDEPTGVALIQVDGDGETTIAVAPGANAALGAVELPPHDAVLCQLEIPDAAVLAAWERCSGLFCLNAAPARPIAVDADLTVVNRHELEALARRDGLVALTLGAEGAVLLEDGEEVARAAPPPVDAVDGTAAGDAFTACLLVSLLEGRARGRGASPRLRGGALAASRFGAQPSLPTAAEVDELMGR